jgi:hypothetical protein
MIPLNDGGGVLTSGDHSGAFLSPDSMTQTTLVRKERGGIGLSDPSVGLEYQDWTATYDHVSGNVEIEAPNHTKSTLFTRTGITELDFTFDQNMHPFVCFVENAVAKYWWYDTALEQQVFSDLPAGSVTPRCCMDDKRFHMHDSNDIILCYVRAGDLQKRIQRDRYDTEVTIKSPFVDPVFGLPGYLRKVGMNVNNRLQWECATVAA